MLCARLLWTLALLLQFKVARLCCLSAVGDPYISPNVRGRVSSAASAHRKLGVIGREYRRPVRLIPPCSFRRTLFSQRLHFRPGLNCQRSLAAPTASRPCRAYVTLRNRRPLGQLTKTTIHEKAPVSIHLSYLFATFTFSHLQRFPQASYSAPHYRLARARIH